jgi:Yip1-like protein
VSAPTAAHPAETALSKGLVARIVGVIFSPRATYAAVVARPRVLGVLVVVLVLVGAATTIFMSTEVGKNAYIDQAVTAIEGFGAPVTDQMMERIEAQAAYAPYITMASQVVFVPVLAAIFAGLSLAVFNAILGMDATFKQAFAVVVHSYMVIAFQTIFSLPLNYLRESLSSATSLAIFFPMIDDANFLGRLMGSIDLFRIWWLVSLAIGFGVLYKRRTGPIAWALLAGYLLLVLIFAGVRTALSGA